MKIKVDELKYSIRMFMLFESIAGRTYQGGLNDNITLFYSAISTTAKANERKGLTAQSITADELIDLIDEEPKLLEDFMQWLTRNAEEQRLKTGRKDNGDEQDKKKA